MKSHFRWIVILDLGLFAVSPVAAAAKDPAALTESLLRVLIQNQSLALDTVSPEKGCQIEGMAGKIKTLGDYLAHLTASLIPDNGKTQVTSSCKSITDKAQACEVWFSTGGGTESPWRYGIQFQLKSNGQIDPASLRCPGAP